MMEALGAITGLVGAGLQAQNQAQANIINYMNLQFQKENARKQFRLSTAGRTDPFGNKQKYDDLLNEWILSLTPTQQQITKASEREQLLSLTEDAKRNRDIRRAQVARGREAGEDYARVLARFRYDEPRSELSIRDELTNLLAGVSREKAGTSKTELTRTALRQDRGADMGAILKAVDDDLGQNMAQNMLMARDKARGEYAERMSAHNSTNIPILQELTRLMDMGGGAPAQPFNPSALMQLQQQQSAGIATALQHEATNVGGAFKNLAASSGKSPDLSKIASNLSGDNRKARSSQPAYSVMQPEFYDYDRNTDDYGSF